MFTRHFPHWPPGKPKTLALPRTTVYANLEASAAAWSGASAIIVHGPQLFHGYWKQSRQARRPSSAR